MSDTLHSKTSLSLHCLAELQRRRSLTPNVAICLRSYLCSPSAPASPPSSPSLPPANPLSLLPLLPLPPPLAVPFSSFTAVTANPTSFLLRDAVAGSSVNLVATAISLSLFLLAVADDMRVLTALTLLRHHRPRLRLHQPAGPCFRTRRRSHRPRPLPSSLFPSRRRRGRATGTFFPCFLTASSHPSPLRPRPASSATSFSFDAVHCCCHGLEVAVSLHWSLLRVRTLPPSPVASRLYVNPIVADARSSLPPFSSLSSAAPRLHHCRAEKTASTSFTAAFLSDSGIDRSPLFLACGFCSLFNRLRI